MAPRFRRLAVAALAGALFFPTPPVRAQAAPPPPGETRLLRYPHVHGDRVVFTYAGDLYTAPLTGGQATRLTSDPGMEVFARFSPDGRWIAFSGEYTGTRQVYLIPSTGGTPRQLTFYPDVGPMPPRGGYDHLVLDWTPDGKKILVRSARTPFGERVGKYFLVDPWKEGVEQPLEIPEGASGATFDATGTKLAFNVKSREWRHWKRYEGGRQQDIWLYDLAHHSSRQITDYPGTDDFPLWVGNAIYFTSDRGAAKKLNLWKYDIATGQTTQVTQHADYDVLWPSRGDGGIVYQNGGWLYRLDSATDRSTRIPITVPGDRPFTTPYWAEVADRIESFDVSPSAKRVVFGARGEIFTVPAEHGNTVNLSRTPAHRERGVTWSPDGRSIAYLSDATGEYELYIRPADGSGEPRQLTKNGGSWMDGPRWSPDSRWIAWSDQDNHLRAVDVENGQVREIDATTTGPLSDFAWAPDSRWIAYGKRSPNTMNAIWLYSFERDRATRVTGDMTDESRPAFDPKGRYLYFVSARDFSYGDLGFQSRVYLATLHADDRGPFTPRNDVEPAAGADDEGAGPSRGGDRSGGRGNGERGSRSNGERGDRNGGAADVAPLRIDLEGLGERVVALPGLEPGRYGDLTGTDDGVLFMAGRALKLYSLEDREAKTVLDGIRGYATTPDRSKLLYTTGRDYGIVPVRPGQKTSEGKLDLSGMQMRIDPKVEWGQVYHDAWLIMRDWFYDPHLHGVDWDAMYAKYLPMTQAVTYRPDLDFVLSELIAEMNVGHAYITSSPPSPDTRKRVDVGLLGAEFTADGNRYRIANIFPGENWHEEFRSPLTEPGIDVHVGDYLIAIDGEPVTTAENPYRHLVNKANRIVSVTVSDRADGRDARTYDVRPIESELGLRYQQWVARNAALVDSLSGGRIGYIHLPNTSVPGYRELFEGFRPQHQKEALIIDDRYNGGGFIPEEMALTLGKPLLNYWARRSLDLNSQPAVIHTGPKAVLINGQSSSGGDAFPYYFRELGLGPLIGERTWGGLVGISGNPDFVDGGSISVPRFAFVNKEGEWAVEGEGVSPDIEVLDRPEQIAAGREPMIEAAVNYLLQELKKPQYTRPDRPEPAKKGSPVVAGGGSGGE